MGKHEMQFFVDENGAERENCLVLNFQRYIADLPGTMASIYTFLGSPMSDEHKKTIQGLVKQQKEFGPARRASYLPVPTIKDLGVTREDIEKKFARYIQVMV